MSLGRMGMTRRTMIAMAASAAPALAATRRAPRDGGGNTQVVRYADPASGEAVTIEVLVRGSGPLVVLLPSLGRSAADFDDLTRRLARRGYRTAAVNPRGIGASRGPRTATLADPARDVAEVIRALAGDAGPVVLIGHAYGNRLARGVATWHPELVSGLILLASGGQVPIPAHIAKALGDVFDPSLSPADHIAAVRTAFFAPGNDPEVWRDGWYGAVALEQQAALGKTPPGDWTGGGEVPIFIVQAAQDAVAPPANAEALRKADPSRVNIAILENAGHAMLPEQPDTLAKLVLSRLRSPVRRPH
jgi:pimeloyl-ACP methyl ester carboxylesterase